MYVFVRQYAHGEVHDAGLISRQATRGGFLSLCRLADMVYAHAHGRKEICGYVTIRCDVAR